MAAIVAGISAAASPPLGRPASTGRFGPRGSASGARVVARAAADQDDIESIEARLKGKRSGKKKEGYFDSYPTKPANGDYPPGMWETDPAAWDAKGGLEKAWMAWSGEPGFMFWMNKGALWGSGVLAFVWILFRVVGPAIGLYQLN